MPFRSTRSLALACALVPASLFGQRRDPTAAGLAYKLPGTARMTVRAGIAYKTVPTANGSAEPVALKLNVYAPPGLARGKALPALLLVPGGIIPGEGPMPREWTAYDAWGRLAAASGLVGITADHRMTVADNVDEASADLLDAIAYVRAHAAEFHVDPTRLCVQFHSAGGPISGVLLRDPPPYLRCVVLYYPYLDLEHLRRDTPFRKAYPAAHADSLSAYSPAGALARVDPARLPPIFLARAGRDQIPYLNESNARFLDTAVARGVTIDFMLHATGQHGFDIANHDNRSRQIMAASLAFVRRATGLTQVPE
ncbi:MAG: alpha/beta hydrolase [Gemmatimonadaceae bacterium]